MKNTLRIARDRNIEKNYNIAIVHLNTVVNHIVGQPVVVRYYTDYDDVAEVGYTVNAITAIGIKDGIGKDCYSIISNGEVISVSDILLDTLPDVSTTTNGRVYLCYLEDILNICYYSYGEETERTFTPVDGDRVFYNGADGFIWYYSKGKLKRADDFYTASEVESLIQNIDKSITDIKDTIYPLTCTLSADKLSAEYTGEDIDITLSFSVLRKGSECTPKTLKISKDGSVIFDTAKSSGSYSTTVNKLGITVFEIVATMDSDDTVISSDPVTISVEQYLPVMYGFQSAEDLETLDKSLLTKKNTLSLEISGYYNIINQEDGNYLWIAVPTVKDDYLITMSGIEYPLILEGTVGNFRYYRGTKPQVADTYKIRIEDYD